LAADIFTASGQTRVFTGLVSDTNKPFRVTIAVDGRAGQHRGKMPYNNTWI